MIRRAIATGTDGMIELELSSSGGSGVREAVALPPVIPYAVEYRGNRSKVKRILSIVSLGASVIMYVLSARMKAGAIGDAWGMSIVPKFTYLYCKDFIWGDLWFFGVIPNLIWVAVIGWTISMQLSGSRWNYLVGAMRVSMLCACIAGSLSPIAGKVLCAMAQNYLMIGHGALLWIGALWLAFLSAMTTGRKNIVGETWPDVVLSV